MREGWERKREREVERGRIWSKKHWCRRCLYCSDDSSITPTLDETIPYLAIIKQSLLSRIHASILQARRDHPTATQLFDHRLVAMTTNVNISCGAMSQGNDGLGIEERGEELIENYCSLKLELRICFSICFLPYFLLKLLF